MLTTGSEVSEQVCEQTGPVEGGLSHSHICTDVAAGEVAGAIVAPSVSWQLPAAVLTVWRGGSLVEVESVRERRAPGITSLTRFADDGSGGARERGGKRGCIATFSAASRRRMLKALARLRSDALPLFVTLTLPDGIAHDGRSMKAYLRRFKARLGRAFPGASFVWRLEVKARKSGAQVGEPVPHLHLLLYGVRISDGFKAWLSRSWYEAVGSEDPRHLAAGTQVQAARSGRQVRAYASKLYAAKAGADERLDGVGRYWGVFNESGLPKASPVQVPVTAREFYRFLRVLRGYARASLRRRGRRGRRVRGWRFCFVDDSERWARLLAGGLLV